MVPFRNWRAEVVPKCINFPGFYISLGGLIIGTSRYIRDTKKFGLLLAVRSRCATRGAFSHCKFGISARITVLKFGAVAIVSSVTVHVVIF
eukprot:COSAG02_NODE_7787_length_2845_cov_1.769847_2_plen_91_part_00